MLACFLGAVDLIRSACHFELRPTTMTLRPSTAVPDTAEANVDDTACEAFGELSAPKWSKLASAHA